LVLLFKIQGKKQNQKYFAKSAQHSVHLMLEVCDNLKSFSTLQPFSSQTAFRRPPQRG